MQATVRNLSVSPVPLPPVFSSVLLGAGQIYSKIYSNMPSTDLAQLVALAQAGTIDFPGDPTSGILAGLQVTPALTYVVNGQEPANQPEGTALYSMDDKDIREYSNKVWHTRNRDFWSRNPDDPHGRHSCGMTKLKDNRIMRIAGRDENDNPTTYCSIFDPSNPAAGWVSVAPFPGAQIPFLLKSCTLKTGQVLTVGGDPSAAHGGEAWLYNPKTDTWAATGVIPEPTVASTVSLTVLDNGKVLCALEAGPLPVDTYGPVSLKVYIYNPNTGTWSLTTGNMTEGHGATKIGAVNGNKAYVCGGFKKFYGGMAQYSRKLELYDNASGLWTAAADMPSIPGEDTASTFGNPDVDPSLRGSRALFGQILVGKKIVVVGGDYSWNIDSDWTGITDSWGRASIIVYDIDAATWAIASVALPYPVDSPYVYDIGNNQVLIAGGFNYNTFLDDYRCWIYNIDEDTLQRAADLPNISTDTPGVNVPLQSGFVEQDAGAISINKNLAFYAGNSSYEVSGAYGGQSELYSTANKGGKGKHHGWDDLSGPDKTFYGNRNKSRAITRRRKG